MGPTPVDVEHAPLELQQLVPVDTTPHCACRHRAGLEILHHPLGNVNQVKSVGDLAAFVRGTR